MSDEAGSNSPQADQKILPRLKPLFEAAPRVADTSSSPDVGPEPLDAWERYASVLRRYGIPVPGAQTKPRRRPATVADDEALYETSPSLVEHLPWVEYLPDGHCLLLEDGESLAAFFELLQIGTEGREPEWLAQARDALENAIQDSLDELDDQPWVVQLYAQDESDTDEYIRSLEAYIQPRARDTAFTRSFLRLSEHHLKAIAKPGGLFKDNTVTHLPWRGQTRRVRLVVYRRVANVPLRRNQSALQALTNVCQRVVGGLANVGIKAIRLEAAEIHAWLLRWFNPHPTWCGASPQDRERFYQLSAYPQDCQPGEMELASGTDFSQRLFFRQPRSDLESGTWSFDGLPHRTVMLDRLRSPPTIGHITGERRTGGDAINTLFDQLPEGTILSITLVITPQDTLESHLNYLAKKSVGETIDSEQTREDVREARSIIGRSHKLYRGTVAFFLRGSDLADLDDRTAQLASVVLNAGMQPVREEDEVGPLNSYLRWLPCVYNPSRDKHQRYTQLMFAQHIANLTPVWGRSRGTGHPGITFFNRGGGTVTFDPLNRLDRQMNAHLLLFGPTGSGKSATLNLILSGITAIYDPRLFVIEAGNSFGLFGDFAQRLGKKVHRVKLAPGCGVTLAPFADARRLVETPSQVKTLDVDEVDDTVAPTTDDSDGNQQRDILGELEITARLMVTGAEEREDARMTRADRSLIRQCILDAARHCVTLRRTVLTQDVRDALRVRSRDSTLPETRRARLLEMADAMDIFCQGVLGEIFNADGTPWPEADITIVDLATFAREGYGAELAISYISLINTINNIAERDQFLGRPIIVPTDEGHVVTKNPLLCGYAVKMIKMWRKLGAWFWLATQNIDDLPIAAQPMLNMIEWWVCLVMPPDEVEKISRFRELTPAQKRLMLSARKEPGKFTEGVVLSKSMELLFRAVPPSLYLALAMTEADEKNERYKLMQQHHISELDAALLSAEQIDRTRGITPLSPDTLFA